MHIKKTRDNKQIADSSLFVVPSDKVNAIQRTIFKISQLIRGAIRPKKMKWRKDKMESEISDNAVVFGSIKCGWREALIAIINGKVVNGWKVPIGEKKVGVPVSRGFEFKEVSFAATAFDSKGRNTLQMSAIYSDAWMYMENKLKEAGYQVICLDDHSNPCEFMNIFTVDDRKKFHELGFETRFKGTDEGVIEKTFSRMSFDEHAFTSREIVNYFLGIGIPAKEVWTRRDFGDMGACVRPENIDQALIIDKLRK